MIYEISNGLLTAAVSSRGAELIRLSANGRELLWNGDPRYWEGRSPNLFPVCGRLRGGRFSLDGREYDMPAHGFLKDADLRLAFDAPDMIGFELMSDTGIANSWPFDFRASVVFRLSGRTLSYEINVENVGKKDMPFAWGGHPGFALPFESDSGRDFEDYSIVFSEPCRPVAMEITPDGFVGEGRTPVALEGGVRLPLRRAYFAVDGLFMTGCSRKLALTGPGKTKIVMEYPDCPTLGLWTAAGGSAPFICIEPWSGTPDRASGPEPCLLEEKPDMIRLKPGGSYRGSYKIEITGTD